MIKKLYFNQTVNIGNMLANYTGIYSVESEVCRGLTYGISDGKFALFKTDGVAYCPIEETPMLAEQMKSKDVRDEILSIYSEVKDLQRMEFNIG